MENFMMGMTKLAEKGDDYESLWSRLEDDEAVLEFQRHGEKAEAVLEEKCGKPAAVLEE
eukprot:COSAG01_NODE_4999_length_4557_cov_15.544674_2_plen_59_part_00